MIAELAAIAAVLHALQASPNFAGTVVAQRPLAASSLILMVRGAATAAGLHVSVYLLLEGVCELLLCPVSVWLTVAASLSCDPVPGLLFSGLAPCWYVVR